MSADTNQMIAQLEDLLNTKLQELVNPPHALSILHQKHSGQYAKNASGEIVGLNLAAGQALDQNVLLAITERLPHLEYLNLGQYQGEELHLEGDWPALKRLNLSGKKTEEEEAEAEPKSGKLKRLRISGSFPQLEHLDLSHNALESLRIESDLPALRFWDVGYNQLSEFRLPRGFQQLEYLYLYNNQIQEIDLPEGLPRLHTLHLAKNKLAEISLAGGFSALTSLYLGENLLHQNVGEVLRFTNKERYPKLAYLGLAKNPLVDVFPEGVIGKDNCLAALREFAQASEQGLNPNDEIRVMLVGNSTSGKTSLYQFLVNDTYDEETLCSTHEIDIGHVEIETDEEDRAKGMPPKVRVNFWDLGGQEFYHVIHQLFLGKNTVYLLLFTEPYNQNATLPTPIRIKDAEGNIQEETLELEHFHYSYWLQTIRDRERLREQEEKSPVLLVQNKIDQHPKEVILDSKLGERYGIEDNILYISVAKAWEEAQREEENEEEGDDALRPDMARFQVFIDKLEQKLTDTISRIEIPTVWTMVRDHIRKLAEKEGKNVLSYSEYRKECLKFYEQDTNDTTRIEALTDWLKAIGVLLYYGDEITELEDVVFINPQWISEIIYKILDYQVKSRGGKFDKAHAIRVLDDKVGLAEIFLGLMKYEQFGLIFQIPDTEQYVAPQYLPLECQNKPMLTISQVQTAHCFTLYYPDILPSSVMVKFISKYGQFAQEMPYWKNGIIFLHQAGNKQVFVERIKQENRQCIVVRIQDQVEEIASEIFGTFSAIHEGKEGIQVSVKENDVNSFVEIERLQQKIQQGRKEIDSTTEQPLEVDDFKFLFGQAPTGALKGKAIQAIPRKEVKVPAAVNKDDISNAALYKLLNAAYSEEKLRLLCMLHFEAVFNNFAQGESKDTRIMNLIAHCRSHLEVGKLLEVIREERSAMYQKHLEA